MSVAGVGHVVVAEADEATLRARCPEDGAARLESWLTGDTAKALINGYQIAGEKLFTFNASAK